MTQGGTGRRAGPAWLRGRTPEADRVVPGVLRPSSKINVPNRGLKYFDIARRLFFYTCIQQERPFPFFLCG